MKMEAETTKSPPGSDTSPLDTCGICKELFNSREPKLLPCLHSFCRSCIVPKANDNGVVKCPMCQAESRLADMVDWLCAPSRSGLSAAGGGGGSSSGVGATSGDGANQEEVHICTGCEENATASSYCIDCPEWLCDQCVQAHRRVRVTKDHTIEAKENVANRPNSASSSSSRESGTGQVTLFCPQHLHEPLKLFCETCDRLTCRDCQLGEHKDHKYQFVNEASVQYKQFLQILLSKIKEKQTYIENAYQLIHKRHQEIEEREKVVLNDIKAFAKRLMSEVNNRGKQLVTDLHSICTAKKAQLGYKQKAIVTLSGQLAHALMMAEKIVDCNNTAAMLSSKKLLVQHLKHLLRTRCEVPNPYHVVDINLQYNEELICGYLAKQGALIVDGVTFRGAKLPKPTKTPGSSYASSSSSSTSQTGVPGGQQPQQPGLPGHQQQQQGQQQQQQQHLGQGGRPLQPIAPKMITPGQGPPPTLQSLTAEQRAALMKTLAAKHLSQQASGSNSPTSTMTNPMFPATSSRSPLSAASGSRASQGPSSSSNGGSGASPAVLGGMRFQSNLPVPQSNTVSSTQVVKTGAVYYPPSGLPQHQQQQQPSSHHPHQHGSSGGSSGSSSSRRSLTVQQQLQQQRARLAEQQQQQHRYQQHMSQIKHQMDKMVMELQRQHGSGATSSKSSHHSAPPGAHMTGGGQVQSMLSSGHMQRQQSQQGMRDPSMANAIIIQPATSSGFTGQTSVGNGRDQLTPSPNLRSSPLSQGSRNEVSPAGSLNEGHNNSSEPMVTGVKLNSTVSGIKQESVDPYAHMIGPDGALCIKPEPQTPGTDTLNLTYPNDLSYDDSFITDLRTSKPGDHNEPEPSDSSALDMTQRTPPPSSTYMRGATQDQPYNLCKPITDQVIGCTDADDVLDLSCPMDPIGGAVDTVGKSSTTNSSNTVSSLTSRPVLGTIKPVVEVAPEAPPLVESEPLPLRDPEDVSDDYCAVCQNGGELLCCDTCPKVFHLTCHVPKLTKEPSGTWSCGLCTRLGELKIEAALPRPADAPGSKRKMSMEKLLDREMKVCQRILLELFCNKSSPLFHEPVPKSVPNYHKIISTPMDLGTIKAKLERSHGQRYITIDDFLGDIQLVFTNCTVFNDPESQVGTAGKIMEGFFHDLVNKYLPYFRAWTAAPHDVPVEHKEAGPTKAKRRKRDAVSTGGAGRGRGLHSDTPRSRGKSPVPRGEKTNRKSSEKNHSQTEDKESFTKALQDEAATAMETAFESEDSEEAMIRNLGLIRNQCEPIDVSSEATTTAEQEPQDLPSDPIIDPNTDEDYQEAMEDEDDEQGLDLTSKKEEPHTDNAVTNNDSGGQDNTVNENPMVESTGVPKPMETDQDDKAADTNKAETKVQDEEEQSRQQEKSTSNEKFDAYENGEDKQTVEEATQDSVGDEKESIEDGPKEKEADNIPKSKGTSKGKDEEAKAPASDKGEENTSETEDKEEKDKTESTKSSDEAKQEGSKSEDAEASSCKNNKGDSADKEDDQEKAEKPEISEENSSQNEEKTAEDSSS